MLELGLNPLCVTATTDELSDDRPPQHREPQAARASTTSRSRTNPVVRRRINRLGADRGRRHLLARARHDLHDPGPDRRAARRPADRLGRELRRTSTAARPRPRDEQRARRAAGSRSSAACSACASPTSSARTASSRAHLIQYTYPTDEELQRVGVTGLFLGYYLPWDGYGNALDRPGARLRDVPQAGRGLARQLREPRQPPDRDPRLLQVPQVRLRPRHRPRLPARPPRPPHARGRGRARAAARRQVPVDLPRHAARGDPRRDRHDARRVRRSLRPLHQQAAVRTRRRGDLVKDARRQPRPRSTTTTCRLSVDAR